MGSPEACFEAARYALFCRILPVLRHALLGELQGLRFGVSLARMSCDAASSPDESRAAIARVGHHADAALERGQAIGDWLQPDETAAMTVGEAVQACMDLVRTEWSLRGIELTTKLAAPSRVIKTAPFREMLAAMLVAMGDALPGAADVTLNVRSHAGDVVVSLRGRAATREGERAWMPLSRELRWSDVAWLAHAHCVAWAQRGDHAIARISLAGATR
jgi:hypothetical protein